MTHSLVILIRLNQCASYVHDTFKKHFEKRQTVRPLSCESTSHPSEAGTSITFHVSDEYSAAASDACVISSDSETQRSQESLLDPAELDSSEQPALRVECHLQDNRDENGFRLSVCWIVQEKT